ncbi:phospholipase D/nuclease [Hortaea werneckii]|uniref:PLD phosphodiesterase domain-containing protein n=2 Tax=Hortaea werneckii TaxID=91943 RepID=A0A3M7HZW5_HORWE|nr:phospholipase D/nuclease [Hortaea werneckii]OTA24677.1 hypothetical protein BTJ68_12782 [Hortaea werneckii EXF-2000]KAI6789501.1 phospholipase D/nuclease [Hortaea werneckii]KAI6896187.1 phospholipase D/nuclease [Hortaea werneckii]KAI6917863.1 phospholipase D/nuclease [Hortaea werneckii]
MASESEDEDVKKAIALSLESSNTTQDALPIPETLQETTAAGDAPVASASTIGLAGLDRRAMEQERLARQKARTAGIKRERSISPRELSDARKAPKVEETTFDLPSGARLNFLSTAINGQQASRKSAPANLATDRHRSVPSAVKAEEETIKQESPSSSKPAPPGSLQYPHGVVKKTWAFGHPRHNDIKLEEVLEPQTLRTAVLSAFQWDTDWVLSKLKTPLKGGKTKCVFIMQAKQENERKEIQAQAARIRSFLRLVFPPMEGQTWCMHSKLMLLFHPEKLRIAVPTANLLNFDWGETGSMENSVFLIDLPRLPQGKKAQINDLTHFAQELLYFVQKQGVDADMRDGLLNFDFAATKNMAFIHSVGGISHRDDARRTGFLGLGNAVRHLGLQTDRLELDFAASSIGSLNDSQLQNLYASAKGQDVTSPSPPPPSTSSSSNPKPDFFQTSRSTTRTTAKPSPSPLPPSDVRKSLRIYFPTHETVTASSAGAAGTICLNRKYFENLGFPRECFRDYISSRRGLLSHNKILFARGKRKIGSGGAEGEGSVAAGGDADGCRDVAWVYVGSANCSQSAWGNLTVDRKSQKEKGGGGWKMNCRNWECGVLLPVPPENFLRTVGKKEVDGDDDGVRVKKEVDPDETDSEPDSSSSPHPRRHRGKEEDVDQEQLVGMEVFNGLVDLPFVFPAPGYGGREPWYFQEWQAR